MDRRDFLKSTAGIALGASALFGLGSTQSCAGPQGGSGAQGIGPFGLQVFTVFGLLREDFEGTLEAIAGAGYDQVEFAGYGDLSMEDTRALIDRLGLTSPSNHARNLVTPEGLQQTIEDSLIMGHDYVVMPSVPRELQPQTEETEQEEGFGMRNPTYTAADVRNLGSRLNEIAATCRDAGLRFAYHNHWAEFEPVEEGGIWYDILLDSTDPDLVDFELDLAWATRGGADPVEYFKQYPGRFKLWHVKDMTADNEPCVLGEGIIDFERIFAQANLAGVEYYFVEQDGAPEPVANITASANYLKNFRV